MNTDDDGASGARAEDEQLALVRTPAKRKPAKRTSTVEPLDAALPVARVAVDVALAHLDRPFDYAVPSSLAESAVPGARVRVRFAGRLVNGFVLERAAGTEHGELDKLVRLAKVVSPEPVLAPAIASLAREVADRYAGTMSDVLRLAVPPRHAKVEAEPAPDTENVAFIHIGGRNEALTDSWSGHPAAPAFLSALGRGESLRAVWTVAPGNDPADAVAAAAVATRTAGKGVLVVVPDARDVSAFAAALTSRVGECTVLTADLGPAERYRRWLAVRRGSARVVVGTRAAMFAPVHDLGLAVVWDDGDDLHAEPRAPYPHVREVLALRAHLEGSALLVGGFARTAEGARLVSSGWAAAIDADRAHVRTTAPTVRTTGSDADLARDPAARSARLPTVAWEVARAALAHGPVLVQVPRRGYVPALACDRCREPARCRHCAGPLASTDGGHTHVACTWCGRPAADWSCPNCGGLRLRAQTVGARRTAEELARAFPGVPVRTSGRDGVLTSVPDSSALVVATPGAEPLVDGGRYAGALLLDGDRLVARPDLRASEEALRRWFNAAALVRSGADGGVVVVVADPSLVPVQALVRWDPAGFSDRELAERATLHLPPAARVAALTGPPAAVAETVALLDLPPGAEVLGPTVVEPAPGSSAQRPVNGDEDASVGRDDEVRTLVRVPVAEGAALAATVRAASAVRSAKKVPDHVQVRIDPVALG